jgi:hypothetical protein
MSSGRWTFYEAVRIKFYKTLVRVGPGIPFILIAQFLPGHRKGFFGPEQAEEVFRLLRALT